MALTTKVEELTANNAKQSAEFKNIMKEMKRSKADVEASICKLASKNEELTSDNALLNSEVMISKTAQAKASTDAETRFCELAKEVSLIPRIEADCQHLASQVASNPEAMDSCYQSTVLNRLINIKV